MNPSPDLLAFVEGWEGLRTTAYDDGGGVWTIGIGRTKDVRRGDTCTEEQARAWFADELIAYARALERYITRPPTQQQYDALLSLAYNCGVPAIGESGVMARHNAGLTEDCGNRFLLWNKDGGRPVAGLTKRREAERRIYLHGDYSGRP